MAVGVGLRRAALAQLAAGCAQETAQFFGGRPAPCEDCLELFRRALEEADQDAWAAVYAQYATQVAAWALHHPEFSRTGEEPQYFVNQAFERLWSAWSPNKFARFRDIRGLLAYLKMCVHGAIVDSVRRAGPVLQDLPDELEAEDLPAGGSFEAELLDREGSRALWDLVRSRLHGDRELLVVRCLFVQGIKPSAIAARYPEQFPNIREIYRIRQNVLERLARDPDLRNLAED